MYVRISDGLGQGRSTEPSFREKLDKAIEIALAPSPLVTGELLPRPPVAGKAIAAGAPLFQRGVAKAKARPAIPREKICWIQIVLNKTSGENLVPDGLYGRRTREAVRQFQRRSGLSADGIVGPRTNTALIQIALNHIAQASLLPVDGVTDARVQQEIKRFQSKNSLTPDGIVGPRTRAAMVLALGGQCRTPTLGKKPTKKKDGENDGGDKCDETAKQACRQKAIFAIVKCGLALGLIETAAVATAGGAVAAALAAPAPPTIAIAAVVVAAAVGGEFVGRAQFTICVFEEMKALRECVAKAKCL